MITEDALLPARKVTDLTTLVSLAELSDIVTNEIESSRIESTGQSPEFEIATALMRGDSTWLEARFGAKARGETATYMIDVSARFRYLEPLEVDKIVLRKFMETVAIFAVYPFLREAIASLASRMQDSVSVLPLLRQGELALGDDTELE